MTEMELRFAMYFPGSVTAVAVLWEFMRCLLFVLMSFVRGVQ